VVDPEKADQLVKQYRGIIFPEEKYNDLDYVNKARAMFKKIQNVHFYIKPAGE
jgi:hypothetical protein